MQKEIMRFWLGPLKERSNARQFYWSPLNVKKDYTIWTGLLKKIKWFFCGTFRGKKNILPPCTGKKIPSRKKDEVKLVREFEQFFIVVAEPGEAFLKWAPSENVRLLLPLLSRPLEICDTSPYSGRHFFRFSKWGQFCPFESNLDSVVRIGIR